MGKIITICIAGKNQCAINALNFVYKNYKKYKIVSLPNSSDNGVDGWQKSLNKFLEINLFTFIIFSYSKEKK